MMAHRASRPGWSSLTDPLKCLLLLGEMTLKQDHGVTYAGAQNAGRRLRQAYDQALERFDLLAMPTVPMRAPAIPDSASSRDEKLRRAVEMFANTSAFNVTGHPALTMPCGPQTELPIGLMLIARHFNEDAIYATAERLEQSLV
jgi:amidase